MKEEIKSKEYLMLREEVQTNLKLQQTWSTLSITSVLTFIGVAYQTKTPIFYLIPIIVLLLSAVKVRNYSVYGKIKLPKKVPKNTEGE